MVLLRRLKICGMNASCSWVRNSPARRSFDWPNGCKCHAVLLIAAQIAQRTSRSRARSKEPRRNNFPISPRSDFTRSLPRSGCTTQPGVAYSRTPGARAARPLAQSWKGCTIAHVPLRNPFRVGGRVRISLPGVREYATPGCVVQPLRGKGDMQPIREVASPGLLTGRALCRLLRARLLVSPFVTGGENGTSLPIAAHQGVQPAAARRFSPFPLARSAKPMLECTLVSLHLVPG